MTQDAWNTVKDRKMSVNNRAEFLYKELAAAWLAYRTYQQAVEDLAAFKEENRKPEPPEQFSDAWQYVAYQDSHEEWVSQVKAIVDMGNEALARYQRTAHALADNWMPGRSFSSKRPSLGFAYNGERMVVRVVGYDKPDRTSSSYLEFRDADTGEYIAGKLSGYDRIEVDL